MQTEVQGRIAVAPRVAPRFAEWRDYLALTRPGVLALSVLTGAPPLLRGGGPLGKPIALLAGVMLVGAACSALNAWIERDRDARMSRTRGRPLPSGRIRPAEALGFGLALGASGLGVLGVWGGGLAAAVAFMAMAWYLGVYTLWAKPRTAFHTELGALAGAAPPLIASAGMGGTIDAFGWALFAIVLAWQPPHVWAIELFRPGEYEAAGIPTLRERVGPSRTRARMLAWTAALLVVAWAPAAIHAVGFFYVVVATWMGAYLWTKLARAIRANTPRADRRVFAASLLYLFALFLEMALELGLRGSLP